jgi:hypothetical protein
MRNRSISKAKVYNIEKQMETNGVERTKCIAERNLEEYCVSG